MQVRLQKILSQWGIASRRQAEQMILDGRVRVNGAIAQLGDKVEPDADRLEVDGRELTTQPKPRSHYLLLHKPLGVVSTCADPQGRTTVLDLLPSALQHQGIHPVGRLDVNSTGAIILTNDGELTYQLTHPRHDVAKTYRVLVEGSPNLATLQAWRQGIDLDGRKTRSAEVRVIKRQAISATSEVRTLLEVVLWEGRNRQIRRVAEQLGHPVVSLHRTAIGSMQLGPLSPGRFRHLSSQDVLTLVASTATPNHRVTRKHVSPAGVVHCH